MAAVLFWLRYYQSVYAEQFSLLCSFVLFTKAYFVILTYLTGSTMVYFLSVVIWSQIQVFILLYRSSLLSHVSATLLLPGNSARHQPTRFVFSVHNKFKVTSLSGVLCKRKNGHLLWLNSSDVCRINSLSANVLNHVNKATQTFVMFLIK